MDIGRSVTLPIASLQILFLVLQHRQHSLLRVIGWQGREEIACRLPSCDRISIAEQYTMQLPSRYTTTADPGHAAPYMARHGYEILTLLLGDLQDRLGDRTQGISCVGLYTLLIGLSL